MKLYVTTELEKTTAANSWGKKKINPSACCYLEEYDASGVWVTEPGYFGVHSVNLQCSNVNVNFEVYT